MIQSFFKLVKTLFFLAVLIVLAGVAAVFYFGYRLGDSATNGEGDVPAEELVAEEIETPVAQSGAAKKRASKPETRAKAVLFELRTKKKTAERRLKIAREELTRLEKEKADGEKIAEMRERVASFEREIKNCETAIATANAALKDAKAEKRRGNANPPTPFCKN